MEEPGQLYTLEQSIRGGWQGWWGEKGLTLMLQPPRPPGEAWLKLVI